MAEMGGLSTYRGGDHSNFVLMYAHPLDIDLIIGLVAL
jgi:hypothetical protein